MATSNATGDPFRNVLQAMATTPSDHAALLDQLQSQLNLVLESTGRVFGALASNPKATPTAQVTKLNHVIPVASDRFDEALDQFDNELKIAQAVMRRDLALCRERAGEQLKPQIEPGSPLRTEPPKTEAEVEPSAVLEPDTKPTETAPIDSKPAEPEQPPPTEDIIMEDADQDDDVKHVPALSFDELIAEDKPSVPTPPLAESKPSVAAHTLPTTEDPKPPNDGLQLDVGASKAGNDQPGDGDKAPDTANDVDSLFNDPMSAGENGGENQDFSFDQDGSNGIDFGSFGANFDTNGADNDNISSLLPGLEDYANTQPNNDGADVDLDQLFGVTDANNGMDSQGAGEQRDQTFEDLMDLANFDGTDNGGGGGNSNNNNADFDFESLFS